MYKFPEVLRIETVGRCNYKCIHCSVPTGIGGANSRQVLSKEDFDYRVNQFFSNGYIPKVVVLYHGGEPLLNKELSYFISVLKKMGINKVCTTTNASLLTEKRSTEIIESGLDEIRFSFDGKTPEENDYIRINGDFFRDASNVKEFLRIRRKLGSKTPEVIMNNVQILDRNEINSLKNSLNYSVDIPRYLTDYFLSEFDEIEIKSSAAIVYPFHEESKVLDVIEYESLKPTYCSRLFETITILSNGDVVICCNDLKGEFVLGNIYQESIFEIWNGDKYDKVRMDFKKQKYCDLCNNCNVVNPRYLCKTKNFESGVRNV